MEPVAPRGEDRDTVERVAGGPNHFDTRYLAAHADRNDELHVAREPASLVGVHGLRGLRDDRGDQYGRSACASRHGEHE